MQACIHINFIQEFVPFSEQKNVWIVEKRTINKMEKVFMRWNKRAFLLYSPHRYDLCEYAFDVKSQFKQQAFAT